MFSPKQGPHEVDGKGRMHCLDQHQDQERCTGSRRIGLYTDLLSSDCVFLWYLLEKLLTVCAYG